jgi:hypothetical protein
MYPLLNCDLSVLLLLTSQGEMTLEHVYILTKHRPSREFNFKKLSRCSCRKHCHWLIKQWRKGWGLEECLHIVIYKGRKMDPTWLRVQEYVIVTLLRVCEIVFLFDCPFVSLSISRSLPSLFQTCFLFCLQGWLWNFQSGKLQIQFEFLSFDEHEISVLYIFIFNGVLLMVVAVEVRQLRAKAGDKTCVKFLV